MLINQTLPANVLSAGVVRSVRDADILYVRAVDPPRHAPPDHSHPQYTSA